MNPWDDVLTDDEIAEASATPAVGPQQPVSSQPAAAAWDSVFEEDADRHTRLSRTLGSVFPDGSMPQDKESAAVRLAEETGASVRFIRPRIDKLLAKWNESKFDPEAFLRDSPGFADLLTKRPELAKTVADDYALTTLGGDFFWKSLGGASTGVGQGVEFLNELIQAPGDLLFGVETRRGTPLAPVAGELRAIGEGLQGFSSAQGAQAQEGTALGGDIASPSSWTVGPDPSWQGWVLHGADLLGSIAPVIAAGPAALLAGGAMAGGAAAEGAEEAVREASRIATPGQPSRLEQESAVFRALLEDGVPYSEAVDRVAHEAAAWAGSLAAPIGAVGGAATQRIASPASKILAGRGVATQAAARVVGGGAEEATQEFAEGVAQQAGVRSAGLNESLTKDSFANAVLGGLGGKMAGATGAVGIVAEARLEARIKKAEAIFEAAATSKLAEASPKSFAEVVAAETARTGDAVESLDFDAEPVLRLMQEARITPADLLGEDGAAALQQAVLMGGKFAVPVEALDILAKSPIGEALRQHVSLTPSDLSRAAREGDAATFEMEARKLAEIIDQVEPGEAESELMARLEADISEGFAKKDAKPQIALWRAFVRTRADRMGVPAAQLFSEISVRMRRGEGTALGGEASRLNQPTVRPMRVADLLPGEKHRLGATYHLDAMKRAAARDDTAAAEHHLSLYERHVEAMGLDPKGPTPDVIAQDSRPTGDSPVLGPDDARMVAEDMRDFQERPRGRAARNVDPTAAVPRYHEADRALGIKESLLQRAEALVGGGRQAGPVMAETSAGRVGVFFQGTESPRGFMERRGNEIAITLTPKADKSTFLHETGHAFLEITLELAARPDATEESRQEAAAILSWLGASDRAEITTEMHEKWARSFEAYLMEGKAPTAELRNAFARFKKWLTDIYRTIKNLDVEMDDEVRAIFDRLLAVDEEMEQATMNAGLHKQLFNSAEEAGVTDEEYQSLLARQAKSLSHAQRRVELKALRELERTATKAWKEERAKLVSESEFEYERVPERIAWLFLRGKQALDDGTIIDHDASPRLDYGLVVDAIGPEAARRFWTAPDGAHPDEVASILGFSSGNVMLQRVNALPGKRQWAQDRADALMAERHKGLMESRVALRKEIEKGLHGDLTAEWLAEEDRLLHAKAGQQGKPPPLALIRRAAEIAAERRQVKNLRPHNEQRAERRLAEEAYRAARDTDYGKAGVKKRQQRIQHALFRAVSDLREEMDKAADTLEDARKKPHRVTLNKASPDLLAASDVLLEAVGVSPETDLAPEARVAALDAAFAIADTAANPIPAEDASFLRALAASPTKWRELTVPQARAVRDTVLQLEAIAKRANEIRMGEETVAREDLIESVLEEASKLPDKGKAFIAREQKGRKRRLGERIVGLRGDVIDPEHMFDRLGPTISRMVIDRYRVSRDKAVAMSREVLEPLVKVWKDMPADVRKRRFDVVTDFPFAFPENAERVVDRITLIMMAFNVGNASNLERFAGGFGWDQQAIKDYLAKTLTDAEWDFVQSVFDMMDKSLWPEVAAKEARVKGLPPAKIQATPIVLPSGRVLAGGYFPAVYDERGGMVQEQAPADDSTVAGYFDAGYRRAATRKSHTKERAAHYSEIVRLDWQIVPSHISQVIHDVAFDEMVRDVAPIFEDDRIKEMFRRRLGERRATDPREWLKFVANERAVALASVGSDTARYAMLARSIMVTKAIGWSIRVAASGFADPFVAAARGRKYGGTSAREFGRAYVDANRPPMQRWVAERSPEIRGRMQADVEAERIREIRNFGKKQIPGGVALDAVARTSFVFTNYVDRILATQIWLASYRADVKKGVTETEAQRRADKAVAKNLAGNDRAMMGRLQRHPGFVGSIFVFYSYFGKLANVFNTLGEAGADAVRRRDAMALAEIAGRTMAVMLAAGPLAEFFGGMGPEDDEDMMDYVQREGFTLPLRIVPLVGHTAAGLTQQAIWDRGNAFSSRDPAAGIAWSVGKNLIDAMDGDATGEERAAAIVSVMLAPVRVPMSQPKRTLRYLNQAFITGEETAADPFDFLSGAAFGPRKGRGTDPLREISDVIQGR